MAEKQIFNTVIEFFEEDNWDFQWVEGTSVLTMGFSGLNGKWLCYAQSREAEEQFVFYSVLAVNVPANKRHKVAEFITRVNYGMVIGNFEMDYEDGELRYKTSVDLEGTELGASMIRQLVYANLVITDRYLPGIMRVIYADDAPADILEDIELMDNLGTEFDDDDIMLLFDDDDDDDFLDDFNSDSDDDNKLPPLDLPPTIDGGSPN